MNNFFKRFMKKRAKKINLLKAFLFKNRKISAVGQICPKIVTEIWISWLKIYCMLCFDATLLYRNFHFPMRIVEVGPRLQCEKVLRLLFLRIPLELWAYLILLHYFNPWPDLGGCPCPALSYQHGLPSMYCSHFLARLRKLFELLLYPNISWYVS